MKGKWRRSHRYFASNDSGTSIAAVTMNTSNLAVSSWMTSDAVGKQLQIFEERGVEHRLGGLAVFRRHAVLEMVAREILDPYARAKGGVVPPHVFGQRIRHHLVHVDGDPPPSRHCTLPFRIARNHTRTDHKKFKSANVPRVPKCQSARPGAEVAVRPKCKAEVQR